MNLFTKVITKEVKVVDEKRIKELETEIKELKKISENEIKQIKNDFDSKNKILNNEIVLKISEATQKEHDENNKLRQNNAVLLKQVEILEQAFENMGFDVKDMKEILNKLVDGVVSKNTIQLVK